MISEIILPLESQLWLPPLHTVLHRQESKIRMWAAALYWDFDCFCDLPFMQTELQKYMMKHWISLLWMEFRVSPSDASDTPRANSVQSWLWDVAFLTTGPQDQRQKSSLASTTPPSQWDAHYCKWSWDKDVITETTEIWQQHFGSVSETIMFFLSIYMASGLGSD